MSYRKIFSVVNEYTASTVIARYAISVAAACKADLVLYAAGDEMGTETIRHSTDRHLDHLTTIATEMNIPVTRIIENGSIGMLLPKRVATEQADMVIYPLTNCMHLKTGLSLKNRISALTKLYTDATMQKNTPDLLKQHTVRQLIRSTIPELAIMRAITMAKPHPGHILVPLGKVIGNAARLLLFVAALAKSFNARVTLYHLLAAGAAGVMPDSIMNFGQQLREQGVTVQERSGSGPLGRAVTMEAIAHHNDLIIVGASERSLLRRIFFGNPAADVLLHPPCNTVLFRSVP
jgi:nucleotide-binding universal stress UspA family protein